jgi:hypothetical protein
MCFLLLQNEMLDLQPINYFNISCHSFGIHYKVSIMFLSGAHWPLINSLGKWCFIFKLLVQVLKKYNVTCSCKYLK